MLKTKTPKRSDRQQRTSIKQAMRSSLPSRLFIICGFVSFSGCCALIYQLYWLRELRLVFGGTTAASAATLAVFMGGLGLGNLLLGPLVNRSTRPLRLYAAFEAGIAATCLLTPLLLIALRQVYISAGGEQSLGATLATAMRLLLSGLVMGVPTILMGGTMPAIAKAVVTSADRERRTVALAYAMNTLGAVLGVLAANFWLLEHLGNRITLFSTVLVNATLAFAVWRFAERVELDPSPLTVPHAVHQSNDSLASAGSASERLIYLVSFSVGFCFFLMELVWYRMLGPLLGGTTYTFGLILAIALAGIGIGSILYHLLSGRLKPQAGLLALTCAVEAVFMVLPFWYGDEIARWTMLQQMEPAQSFLERIMDWSSIAGFVVLPASVVAGFQFPLLLGLAGKAEQNVARHVAGVFGWNTFGSILGSLAGGFWLLPLLTAPGLWRLCVGILLLASVIMIVIVLREHVVTKSQGSRSLSMAAIGLLMMAVVFSFSHGPTAAWRHSGIGAGRVAVDPSDLALWDEFVSKQQRETIWESEGRESSVAIRAGDSLSFYVNGKDDGNAFIDAATQWGLGMIGTILHPKPESELVIGLGTGESAGALAACKSMTSVDIIELEPSVMHMAELCSIANRNVLDDDKVALHLNDAREFLQVTEQSFDIIVSEPSNPYRAGVSTLYTREFYEIARSRLKEGGIFVQWLQSYEVDEQTVACVLKTFAEAFPEVQVWHMDPVDLALIGSSAPLRIKGETVRNKLRDDETLRTGMLQTWRADNLAGLASHFICGTETVAKYCKLPTTQTNCDDRNILEFAFAKSLATKTSFATAGKLGELARQLGDRPFEGEQLSNVEVRAQLMADWAISHEELPDYLTQNRDVYLEFLDAYLAGEPQIAIESIESTTVPNSPVWRSVYLHASAEAGVSLPAELLRRHKEQFPAEAAAIEGIQLARSGMDAKARITVLNAFRLAQNDPWISTYVFRSLFQTAIDLLGRSGDEFDNDIYALCSSPLALHRMEGLRQLLCIAIDEGRRSTRADK